MSAVGVYISPPILIHRALLRTRLTPQTSYSYPIMFYYADMYFTLQYKNIKIMLMFVLYFE